MSEAILVLEDGRCFHGESFGATGETFGQLVFDTSITGYQRTLTDPRHRGEVVMMTVPHIGNTGWCDSEESGHISVSGFIVRDPAPRPSHWQATRSLDDALRAQGIVGISGVDTRALTRHVRTHGAVRVGISTQSDAAALLSRLRDQPLNAVTEGAAGFVMASGGPRVATMVALDLGNKGQSVDELTAFGIEVHVLPASASFADISASRPDGVFISDGPGQRASDSRIGALRDVLAAKLPVLAVGRGMQLLALALGLETYELPFGHQAIAQPVVELASGVSGQATHNHGYAVRSFEPAQTEYGLVSVSHVATHDSVVEGLELTRDGRLVALAVQFDPAASADPLDSRRVFARFLATMRKDV